KGLAVVVDAGAADVGGLVGKREAFFLGDVVEDAERLGHDFGADVVAGKDGKFKGGHGRWENGDLGAPAAREARRLWGACRRARRSRRTRVRAARGSARRRTRTSRRGGVRRDGGAGGGDKFG